MIPRRQGFSDINVTIPVGDGKLPPIPEAAGVPAPEAPAPVAQPVQPKNNASKVIEAISVFSKVSRRDAVDTETLKLLLDKKLIVSEGDYAVVSEKGLRYLVDFTL